LSWPSAGGLGDGGGGLGGGGRAGDAVGRREEVGRGGVQRVGEKRG
jgi:hypothetical protein